MLHPGQVPVGLSVGMAAPWHALVDELQGNYSIELYGKPNSVDADHLQLIWTPLLTPAALEALQMLGVCHFQPEQEQPLFYPLAWPPTRVALCGSEQRCQSVRRLRTHGSR